MWFAWKIGGASASISAQASIAFFAIYRSVDNTGAPTATSATMLFNSAAATIGSNFGAGHWAVLNFTLSVSENTNQTGMVDTAWCMVPGQNATGLTGTSTGGNAQCYPVLQWARTSTSWGFGITNASTMVLNGDVALGNTFTTTILGATNLTYVNVGTGPGTTTMGFGGYNGTNYAIAMLWQ
jgi:hypothetical protein